MIKQKCNIFRKMCLELALASKKQESIDAEDAGNDLAAVEYIEDIYKFYKLVEVHIYMHIFPLN